MSGERFEGYGKTAPIALLSALLRALIAQQESAALSKALGTPVSGPHDAALTQSSDAEMGEKT